MSRRTRGLLFGLGVLLGLGVVGAALVARQNGLGLRFSSAEVGLVYLSPVDRPEIWRNSPDGQKPQSLTDTSGTIFDYGISPDGREIVYSAGNELKGLDLWLVPSTGGSPRSLLDCGADRCSGPAYAPDGSKIAYSRRSKAENPAGSTPGPGRIWLLSLKNGETSPLVADAAVTGQEVSWSPDGSHLAFYDLLAGAIRIHTLKGGTDLVLPVLLEKSGGWTRDGNKLVFADYALGQERPVGALSEVDLATGQVSPAFTDLDLIDFGSPVFDPRGVWMAVGGQAEGEGSARSIWVVRLDGTQKLRVTIDPQASQAGYRWDSSGERLVYQEYKLGKSDSHPAVYIWDLQTQAAYLVAENAALPAWVQ
jgi:Tol biopolymer transport system component